MTYVKIANILLLFLEMEIPALLFLSKFQLRRHWLLRLLFVCVLTVAASWALVWIKDHTMARLPFSDENMTPYLFTTSAFQLLNECAVLCLVALSVSVTAEVSQMNVVFICCTAFSMQSIAESIATLAVWVRLSRYYRLMQFLENLPYAAMYLAVFTSVYISCYFFVIQKYTFEEQAPFDHSITRCTIALLSVSVILGSVQIPEHSKQAILLFFFILLARLLVGVLGLVMLFALARWVNLQFNYARQEYMNQLQIQQYQLAKESVETVNINAHDLRHQIGILKEAIRQSGSSPELQRELQGISDAVSVVDSYYRTGNRALDITLTQKSMRCQENSIEFSAMVDGTALLFMTDIDIYVLLGNALDNAIEAVSQIPDPKGRVINLYIRKETAGTIIHLENTYEEPPVFTREGPLSQKKSPLHGFGTKSMRNIVSRYSGSLRQRVQDSLFILDCYLPSPDDGAE